MNKKFRFALVVILFVLISLKYSGVAREYVAKGTNSVIGAYLNIISYMENTITEHFNQQDEIQKLRMHNEELKRSALLSVIFAGKLNRLLQINEHQTLSPKLALVESTSYVNINDYNRVWVKMKEFNASKIYGLTYHGNSAGIIIEKDGNPLALLQGDEKCIFSVSVGDQLIPGVAIGQKQHLHVKYIPLWMSPKKGDKVMTSGLDKIFFKGIPVGEVVKVVQEESYQTAIVKPNATPKTPDFFYTVL